MPEREIKMLLREGAALPKPERLLRGLDARWSSEQVDQDAVYFDTADLALSRGGASLRYRSDDGWTVKLPQPRDGSTLVRDEYVLGGDRADGGPPAVAAGLVRALTRTRPLAEVARITTKRRKILVHGDDGRRVLEIDEDNVTATVPGASPTRFREIEVEAGDDLDPALTREIVRRLHSMGARRDHSTPKVVRALGGRARRAPDTPTPPELGSKATAVDLVRAAVGDGLQRLITHDPIVRIDADPEGVHQARVATRRLRSDLRTLRPVVAPGWSEPLRDELRWLGELLGRVRDADVLLAGLSERAADLPSEERQAANRLIAELHEMRARDHAALVEAMNTSRYVTLLERLVVAARRPELRAGASDTRVTKLAARLTRRPQKRLQRSIERLDADDPADRDLHEVRKRAKQVRYALESVAPVTGKKAKCTANRVAALQDLLGEHQDAVVAAAWLREAALDSAEPMVAFAAGRLAGAYDGQRRARRRAWRDAWDATGLA